MQAIWHTDGSLELTAWKLVDYYGQSGKTLHRFLLDPQAVAELRQFLTEAENGSNAAPEAKEKVAGVDTRPFSK